MSSVHQFSVRDNRDSGWLWVDHAVIDDYGRELGAYGLAVYMVLAKHADRQQTCYPSFQTIADKIGCSRRQVIRSIARMEKLGLVRKVSRMPKGAPSSNEYALLDVPRRVGGDSQSLGSDSQSLPPSDSQSLPSDSQSPELKPENKNHSVEEKPDNNNTHTATSHTKRSHVATGSCSVSSETERGRELSPIVAYTVDRFSRIVGRELNEDETKDLIALDEMLDHKKARFSLDKLAEKYNTTGVNHPMRYLQQIVDNQEKQRWPGLNQRSDRRCTSTSSNWDCGQEYAPLINT